MVWGRHNWWWRVRVELDHPLRELAANCLVRRWIQWGCHWGKTLGSAIVRLAFVIARLGIVIVLPDHKVSVVPGQ